MTKTQYAPSYARITGRSDAADVPFDTVAELLHRLGDISPDRIRLVPTPGTATEADVLHWLEGPESRRFELIDGTLVEKPQSAYLGLCGSWISTRLWNFVDEYDLGVVLGPDAPTRFRLGLVRLPDIAFVAWKRIPDEDFPADKVSAIIPNLAIEVLSESNTTREIDLKLNEYFAAGVQVAWIIDPATESAQIYTSRSRHQDIGSDGVLVASKVLPGFRLPFSDVFECGTRHPKKKRK